MFYCIQTAGMLMTASIIYSVKTHKFLVYLSVVSTLIVTLFYDFKLYNFFKASPIMCHEQDGEALELYLT